MVYLSCVSKLQSAEKSTGTTSQHNQGDSVRGQEHHMLIVSLGSIGRCPLTVGVHIDGYIDNT